MKKNIIQRIKVLKKKLYIKQSGIEKDKQIVLILESVKLNSIIPIIEYNQNIKILIPEYTNVAYEIAKNYYNKYGKEYINNIEFYPIMTFDDIVNKTCNRLPNIIFADFTNTYTGLVNKFNKRINRNTIEKILECLKSKKLILGLTFSLRNMSYYKIN